MRAAAVVVAAVLTAVPAFPAADKCLSGDSALGDRRALAALRAATDKSCSCTGSRGAWLRCARGQVATLAGAGTLRKPCKAAAKKQVSATTCGTKKTVCAELAPAAKSPIGCRITAAGSCRDRGKVTADACAAETHCTDAVDWGNGTCLDPRRAGPYPVGVRVVTYTKKSVVDPTRDRALATVVWYPAANAGPIDATYKATVGAPVAAGGPFPLVVFSHGSCGYALQSPFLMVQLATYGFVVASVPHPGNTINEFPMCGTAAVQVASAQERPADVRFVLDQLLAATADGSSPFFHLMDPARVGMMGHSFGGYTTHVVISQDSRFKVGVPLAAAVPNVPVPVPTLMMLGKIDSVVSLPAIRAAHARAVTPKFLVEIENAGHYAFSQGCFPSPDCKPPTTLTQDEAHALVLRYAIPFLEVYLAGDATWAPLLAPPPAPGVTLDREG